MEKERVIYTSKLIHKEWKVNIAATDKGLCYISAQNEPFDELKKWINKRFPSNQIVENDDMLIPFSQQLKEYFDGERQDFTILLDLHGTEFQKNVWKTLCTIPYGETTYYSDIAAKIENPKAVRAVGTAIGANPLPIVIPCHRVIGKDGSLTGYSGGLDMKKQLLDIEGIHY